MVLFVPIDSVFVLVGVIAVVVPIDSVFVLVGVIAVVVPIVSVLQSLLFLTLLDLVPQENIFYLN